LEVKRTVEIRNYNPAGDEKKLFDMMQEEGLEWKGHWGEEGAPKYKAALAQCIVFVAYEKDELCGFARCRNDDGFGVYIYDLLVRKQKRGKNIGRGLMDKVCETFPGDVVYVMSDVDIYYEKQGYSREGSIFIVRHS